MANIIICAVIAVVCILGVRSYAGRLSHGCCGGSTARVRRRKPEDADVSHYPFCYQLEIHGMTCRNCAVRIENAFNDTGNCNATVDAGKGVGVVRAKSEISEEELRRVVAKCGYSVGNICSKKAAESC